MMVNMMVNMMMNMMMNMMVNMVMNMVMNMMKMMMCLVDVELLLPRVNDSERDVIQAQKPKKPSGFGWQLQKRERVHWFTGRYLTVVKASTCEETVEQWVKRFW